VREDLPPGLRAAQAGHAIADTCLLWEREAWEWTTRGNYLIILGVPDLESLSAAWGRVLQMEVPASIFEEPDLGGEATAIACLPPPEMNAAFADLPLAYAKRRRWWPPLLG